MAKHRRTKEKARKQLKTKTNAQPYFNPLIPQYNEISLFLMSISLVLLFIIYPSFRSDSILLLGANLDFRAVIALLLFLAGIFLSLIHVLTDRKKFYFEKAAMLFFAIMVNCASGLTAGIRDLGDAKGFLVVFPICNIISAVLLLIMYRYNYINVNSIVDDNASIAEVLRGTMTVVLVLVTCRYAFNMDWAVAFSICVTYATNLNILIKRFINS